MMAIASRAKIGVWFLLTAGLVGALMLIRSTTSPELVVPAELKAQAESLASAIAEQQRAVIEGERKNRIFLQDLAETLGGIGGLRWVEVFDENAVVVAHTLPDRVGGRPLSNHEEYVRRLFREHKAIEEADREHRRFNRFVPVTLPTATGAPRTVAVIEVVMDWDPDHPAPTSSSRLFSHAAVLAVRNGFEDIERQRSHIRVLVRELSNTTEVHSIAVFDSGGTILAHSEPDRVGKPVAAERATHVEQVLRSRESTREFHGATNLYYVVKPVHISEDVHGVPAVAAVELVMDAAGGRKALAAARQRTSFLAVILFVIVIVCLYIAVSKLQVFDGNHEGKQGALERAAAVRSGKYNGWLLALCVVLSLAVLVVDLLIPLGVASAVPYAIVVFLTAWSRNRRDTYILAILATVLTWLGYILSGPGGIGWMVAMNRGLAILVTWTSALLILQRKRTNAVLTESEQRLRQIAENSNQVFWLTDWKKKELLYVSPTYEDIYDRTCKSLYEDRRSWIEAVHPEDRSRVDEAFSQQRERGEYTEEEYRIVRRDGSVRWIHDRSIPVNDKAGRVERRIGVAEDITERKQAEERAARFSRVLESSLNEIYIFDAETLHFIEVNRGARQNLGYSMEEMCDLTPLDLKPQLTADSFADLIKSLRTGSQEQLRFSTVHRRKDGSRYPVEVHLQLMRGDTPVFVAIILDITERKRAEEQLRETNAQLEEQTARANDMAAQAETASAAKSEFLANMSHEIRTPMTAILGFTETMLDPDLSDSDRLSAVHTVHRNGEHLLQIINDILDISKIEAGKLEVERIRCSPVNLVAEVKALMQVRADAKKLPFKIEYIGPVPETIESDPTRLKQILVNLIGNAIKFTETGDIRIITRFVDDGAEPNMQFDVIDTGLGMTAEQVGKLFQAFSQADTSTTRNFGGTGLGLIISRRLATLLGGNISVESKPGEGSLFRVTVTTGSLDGVKMIDPASATAAAAAPRPESLELTVQPGLDPQLDCRILLAEDYPANQRLMSVILKRAGADVTVVENGREAVDRALAAMNGRREDDPPAPFDVILMDMQMPVMDGYEATRLLRQRGYTGRIIALTAHAMASDRQKCLDAGCDDYASKPIDRKKLIATIQEWRQKRPIPEKKRASLTATHETAEVFEP